MNVELPDVWTSKDGQQNLIEEMEDGHIMNTIRYLERTSLARGLTEREESALQSALSGSQLASVGAGAQMAISHEVDRLEDKRQELVPGTRNAHYGALVAEARKRQLIP